MPKKIEMPLMPEFEGAMLSGKKTAATRTKRYGYPGWFEAILPCVCGVLESLFYPEAGDHLRGKSK